MKNWMTVSQAGEALGITCPTIRRWLAEGRLRGYQSGRVVRIDPQSVSEMLGNARTAAGGTEKASEGQI